MTQYHGKYADWYDVLYQDKPYAMEAAFIDSICRKFGGESLERVLDIACGTGRHVAELERYGYTTQGTDISPDMIARARSRFSKADVSKFNVRDMRIPDASDNPFDVVLCLFDSIGYAGDDNDILATFSNVSQNLGSGGLFFCEFWHAGAMLNHAESIKIRRINHDNQYLLRVSETEIDEAENSATVNYELVVFEDERSAYRICETHKNRFFYPEEIADLLRRAGLSPVEWFAGYTENEAISNDVWHIVSLSRKP